MALEWVCGADFSCNLMCGAGPGDLGGSRGSISAGNPRKTGPEISSQTACRYPIDGWLPVLAAWRGVPDAGVPTSEATGCEAQQKVNGGLPGGENSGRSRPPRLTYRGGSKDQNFYFTFFKRFPAELGPGTPNWIPEGSRAGNFRSGSPGFEPEHRPRGPP